MFRIFAWEPKTDEDGNHLVACDIDDPSAVRWDVGYPNPFGLRLEFDCKTTAVRVQRALQCAHEQGGKDKLAELRRFLDVK